MKKAASTLLTAALAATTLLSCAKDDDRKQNTYVLVHGAWQAPYVWDEVRDDLSRKGNKVVVVELPGHGKDTTPTYTLSLDIYRDKVIKELSAVEGPVILVGHSMGGMVVTAVAETVPARIRKLVYIGAFVPQSGQALAEISDPDSQLGPSLIPSQDQLTIDVKKEDLASLFIADGSAQAKQLVLDNYRAEPAIPFTTKVTLTEAHFGTVDKVYIKTLQDKVISPGLQDKMITAAGIGTIYTVNTSHSPFLSQPHQVAELLLKSAQ
ncbi:alpha/beta fold hydrolase [Taibaiella helva]|uniref:alpha/beta fold hydrolase n=1 Tax=Taibaiella helva TaxID=2301235 RepID=UPI000E58CC30|nr:alpha/beta fold hydrolase [Taibaiella helva]